jgi:hypothetical protein
MRFGERNAEMLEWRVIYGHCPERTNRAIRVNSGRAANGSAAFTARPDGVGGDLI